MTAKNMWHEALPLITGVAPLLAWALNSPYHGTAVLAICDKLGLPPTTLHDDIIDKILIGHIDTLKQLQAAETKLAEDLRGLKIDIHRIRSQSGEDKTGKERNPRSITDQMKRNILYFTTFGVFTIIITLMWNGKINSETMIYIVGSVITQWGLMTSTVFGAMVMPTSQSPPYGNNPSYGTPPYRPLGQNNPSGTPYPSGPAYYGSQRPPSAQMTGSPPVMPKYPQPITGPNAADDDALDAPSRRHTPDS